MIIRKEETGPTWRELLNQGTEQLLAAGIDEALKLARELFTAGN